MERSTRQFTISLPPDLAEQVTALAQAESRTISELFREAFRSYRAGRIRALLDASQAAGKQRNHMGYTPDDVQRVIRETRQEQRPAKRRQ
ncbi:MAG TPA: ribbon-helix-helix domain-containing protein [Acidobacteriaceae bacterium]|nr:ribbon-helix-helix domain-containing protein [Acidobacteriaceae bacterium]